MPNEYNSELSPSKDIVERLNHAIEWHHGKDPVLLKDSRDEIERLRGALITISSVDVDVIVSERMWSDMSPKDIYEKGLMNGAMAVRDAVKTEAYAILALGEKE